MSSARRDVEDEVILRKATKSDLNRISFFLEQLGYSQINAELYKRFTVYQNTKG